MAVPGANFGGKRVGSNGLRDRAQKYSKHNCQAQYEEQSMWGHRKFYRVKTQNAIIIMKTNDLRQSFGSVDEWLRAWDTLTMFEATVCGSS